MPLAGSKHRDDSMGPAFYLFQNFSQQSTFAPFEPAMAPPGLHFGDAVLDVCFGEAVDSLGCQAYWLEVVTRDGL